MLNDTSKRSDPVRILIVLFIIIATVMSVSIPVSADMGPKPSVTVTVTGLSGNEVYYATLLSERESTGPFSRYDESRPQSRKESVSDPDIWQKFVDYADPDGYYYLQQHWQQNGDGAFIWSYYPPDPFKVLLYFPDYDSFAVSDIITRYTFDSSYTVDLGGVDYQVPGSISGIRVEPKDRISVTWILDVTVRVALTLAIELLVAFLFVFREKKQLIFIAVVNISTQLMMNAVLLFFRFHGGFYISAVFYFLTELGVFALEAVLYVLFLKRFSKMSVSRPVIVAYALVANILSCAAGLISAYLYHVLSADGL